MGGSSNLWIPGATHEGKFWFGDTTFGVSQDRITKLVLHSTETSPVWGCPWYKGGPSAPTITVDPWNLRSWQHFHANTSAKALVDPTYTSVRENRDNVAQIEIIGYSDRNLAKTYGHFIGDIPDRGLAYIAAVVRWYHDHWGLPLKAASRWLPYPESYGASSVRMSGAEYDAFQGVLGHQHVSGNTHGDPGVLNVDRIMQLATGTITPPTPKPSEEDELMAITVKNPLTGDQWPLADALWSMWTYSYQSSIDAKAALAVAKVAAAKGEPLTAEETEAAVREAVKDAVVTVNVGFPAPEPTP